MAKRVDLEYRHHGTASVLMLSAPLEDQRHVRVSEYRKWTDFAAVVRALCDVLSPTAQKIVFSPDYSCPS